MAPLLQVTHAHLEAVKALEKTCSGGNRKLRRHALDQGPGLGAVWGLVSQWMP